MRYEFRPLEWAGPVVPGQRKIAQFRATYPATLELLFREAEYLGAEHLILQVDIRERDIRTDGLPRANARHGENPGVIISFESRFGPLRYATDTYTDWQDNLRAIALSLQALRAVDRYGASKRGEQYTGWRAIAAPGSRFATPGDAERWMRKADDLEGAELALGALYRKLARRMHPDTATGNPDAWESLDDARQVLAEAGQL
jgi:hypothetical protein